MIPFDKEHMSQARRLLAEFGIELTPNELEEIKDNIFTTLRVNMIDYGLPEFSDEEILTLIRFFRINKYLLEEPTFN